MESLIGWILHYRYLIIFPLTIVEGPVIMALSGFLLRLGYFDLLPLYLVLMAGDLAGDTLWYLVGYFGGHHFISRFGKFFSIEESAVEKITHAFHKHHNKILFVSKITMGFGFALVTLITAGLSRVPFRKYIFFNALGQVFWTGALIAIGYFFGNIYLLIDKGVRDVTIFVFVIILLAALYGFGKYIKKTAAKRL